MENKYDGCGILKIGRGCGKYSLWMKYLMELENEFARLNNLYGCDKVKEIMKSTCCSVFEVEDYINKVQFTKDNIYDITQELANEYDNQIEHISINHIIQLKSQLKHCKNHMQRLNIERELNKLYKNKER